MTPTSPKDASKLEDCIEKWTVPIGNLFVSLFHRIALFGIGAATVWSAAVAFLVSPAASYINGINVPVDGGRTKSL